jgi:hypothetical protein
MEHSLVMGIPYPGVCAYGTGDDSDAGKWSNDEDRVGVHRMVSEVVHYLEDEPADTGQRTTAVNASQMLRCHCEVYPTPRGRVKVPEEQTCSQASTARGSTDK